MKDVIEFIYGLLSNLNIYLVLKTASWAGVLALLSRGMKFKQ